MTAAERAREYRRRRREQATLVTVEIFEPDLERLQETGLLAEADSRDRLAITRAVFELIDRAFVALGEERLPAIDEMSAVGGAGRSA